MCRINYSIWDRFGALGEYLSEIEPEYKKYKTSSVQTGVDEELLEILEISTVIIENSDRIKFEKSEVFDEMMRLVDLLKNIRRMMGEMEERIRSAAYDGQEKYYRAMKR